MGQIEKAPDQIPVHPEWFFAAHGAALRQNQEYEKALAAFRKISSIPGSNHMQLAAILARLDQQSEAEEAIRVFLTKSPHHTVSRERSCEEPKFVHEDQLDLWLDSIRVAGLPD